MNTAPVAHWSDAEVGDLVRVNAELTALNRQLDATQDPLVQPEKTASIGQLAAQAITRERGSIVVRIASGDDEGGVEIDDDGCGIAPESLQRIFDPFFIIRPVDKGTGPGQSLAYGIVNKHRGHIDVTSEPGRGTCFCIPLPIERKQAAT